MTGFTGKTILVTGASSGIGRSAAVKLAAQGASVIVSARREAEGRATVDLVEAAGGTARFIPVDIAERDSIDALFAAIGADYGKLDGAFNNAGIEADAALLPDTPEDVFDRVFSTNVRGTWLCLRHEMRLMRAQGHGSIVNTSSIAGLIGFPYASVYTASKHAIVGMTKSAGLDLAEMGIRVNCLCPGATHTDMAERWAGRIGGMDAMAKTIPMKRIGSADELADAAVWLLSDGATYVTGTTIVVDGGVSVP